MTNEGKKVQKRPHAEKNDAPRRGSKQTELELQNEELRRMQKELDAVKARYFELNELAPLGYCIINDQGLLLESNLNAALFLGMERDEMVGQPIARFILEDDLDIYNQLRKQVHAAKDRYELRMVRKDGTVFWVLMTVAATQAPGMTLNHRIAFSDITERKATEEALRESEEKYRIIFNNEIYAICIFDLQTLRLLDINDAYCHLYGYGREELTCGMTIHDITAEHQSSDAATQHACRNGTIFIPLRYHRKKDGMIFPVEIVGGPYVWKGKKVMFALTHDISDRKQAEDTLADHRRRLASIIEGTNVGTWEWNVQTGETIFNERWAEIIGYRLEELLPSTIKTWEKFAHPDDLQRSAELLARHFSGEMPIYECEIRMQHKDGHWVWVLDRGRVMTRTGDNQPQMMFGTHTDISKRKQNEKALQNAHSELELRVLERTADLEKTNATLAMMLDYARKTEMEIQERVVANIRANILGIVDILKKQELTTSARELVELLETSTQNLAHPLARNLDSPLLQLTTREMQLANYIRLGKSTKELTTLLNLSPKTVESHRNNLRKKLGLRHKKVNLRTFLNSQFEK